MLELAADVVGLITGLYAIGYSVYRLGVLAKRWLAKRRQRTVDESPEEDEDNSG